MPFPVFLVLFEIKIHIEERFMLGEFPDEYPRYRQRVPELVPGLRLISGRRVASSDSSGRQPAAASVTDLRGRHGS